MQTVKEIALKAAARSRKYYTKNKVKINAKNNAKYKSNPENKKDKIARAKAWGEANRERKLANQKSWWDANKYKVKEKLLKRKYNITVEDYNKLFEEQECKCKICKRHQNEITRNLVVDHNHITKKVRGLLCDNCNIALGLIKDNKIILENMIEYLNNE